METSTTSEIDRSLFERFGLTRSNTSIKGKNEANLRSDREKLYRVLQRVRTALYRNRDVEEKIALQQFGLYLRGVVTNMNKELRESERPHSELGSVLT